MQGTKTIFTILINFFLILSLVSAVQISPESLSEPLCPRETGLFTHTVRNDNNAVKEYTINLKGSAAAWATSVPRGFILGPNEEKNLFTYVTPSQLAEPGNYNLEIEAASPGDLDSITHTVTVRNCYDASFVASPNTLNSCPSEPVRYTLTLTNNGEYMETFHLSVSGDLASRVTLSDSILILNKGESKQVLVFVNSPVDSSSYGVSVVAESESGRIRESVPLFLNVNPCYDFSLTVQGNTSYSLCDRSQVFVPLRLANDGTTINSFDLELDGPSFVRLERDNFVLRDTEVRNFNMIIAPNYGAAGDYALRLSVIPERGNLKAVTDFAITVRKCHSVDVEFAFEEAQTCKGTINTYEAVVTNDGELGKTYRLEFDGPAWVSLDDEDRLLTLDPGENETLTVSAVPTGDVKESRFAVTLNAVATDESEVSARDESELILDVKDAENCFKALMESNYEDLVVYYDSSVAIPVEVRNDGVRRAEYSLFLSGNAATFSNLNPSAIAVDPGRSEFVFVYVAPNINVQLGEYDARITLNLKDGPVLATKDFNIEITDVRERATEVLAPGEEPSEEPEQPEESFWTRVKNWFRRVFTSDGTNQTTPALFVVENGTAFVPTGGAVYSGQVSETNEEGSQNFLSLYKYYILGAVIVLLVVILVFQLFFSEKVFGPKKKVDKKGVSKKEAKELKKAV